MEKQSKLRYGTQLGRRSILDSSLVRELTVFSWLDNQALSATSTKQCNGILAFLLNYSFHLRDFFSRDSGDIYPYTESGTWKTIAMFTYKIVSVPHTGTTVELLEPY